MRTAIQKKAQRRVTAERSIKNLISGMNGLLTNEELTAKEAENIREARASLQDNLDNWRKKEPS